MPTLGQMLKILSNGSDSCILLYSLGVTIRELVFLLGYGCGMAVILIFNLYDLSKGSAALVFFTIFSFSRQVPC